MRSLKVLFLATRDSHHPATAGGDEVMWEYACYLASVGHDVTFVSAGFPGAAKAETVDAVKIVRLGGIHSLWLRTFIYYLKRGRGRYDVVVAEGFGGSRIPRLVPLYITEPIITEWHQIYRDLFAVQYPKLLNGPLNLLERVTAWVNRNTLVRAGTEEWRQAFPRIGFKPENIFVLPVSIREEWLAVSTTQRAVDPTVVWLGKVRRYKCPDHAVRAMVEVVRSVPGAKLVIAGRHDDLRYERRLRSLVRDLHLESKVEFRFNVSTQEKRDLLRASRVLVLPSSVEGFGIVVLEANACGVPVVASSGVPEGAVRHGFNGSRYPFGQIDVLSKSIVAILTDDSLHERLSANGLAFASNFGWRHIGSQYEAVLRKAVDDRESSRIAHLETKR
jgi:glycosyltransferase involved in cell wall biosynthesis